VIETIEAQVIERIHQFRFDLTKEKEMADFRKWVLVLAVVALVASPAFAQISCTVSPSVNKNVRVGGITELVGDYKATCSSPEGTPNATVNFTSLMSNTVSNRLLADNTLGQGYAIAAGLQIIDSSGVNVIEAVQGLLQRVIPVDNPAARNQVVFPGVTVPGGTNFTIRIFNIRVVVPAGTTPGIPITELLITSQPSLVAVPNSAQPVATPNNPLTFEVTTACGASLTTFRQCIAEGHNLNFGVKFTEGFASAFHNLAEESGETWNLLPYGGALGDAIGDQANNGTRLQVTFTNIPAGVSLNVTGRPIAISGSADIDASIVTSSGGLGVFANCGPAENVLYPANMSGTTATALWEISSDNDNFIESLTFGVDVFYNPSLPTLPALTGTTPGQILGTLAPISGDLFAAFSPDPIVRFQDYGLSANSPLVIVPCVTNLLFPYLTSSLGYDTGIAIANTTLDSPAFATPNQDGPCTLYFFGQQNGAVSTITPQTSDTIVAGQSLVFSLTNPPAGFDDLTEFTGYVIARCQFQMAHGLAFIVDTNLPGFGSEAYLALVIPDTGQTERAPDPFSEAGPGAGEQLAF
jgi:hypothetical protein